MCPPHCLFIIHHGGNTVHTSVNVIHLPRKVNRPKITSVFKEEESYPDVDEGFFYMSNLVRQCLDIRTGKTAFVQI